MESPVQRVFLEVAYDGTNYCGWQVQPRGVSVQSELERALSILFRQPISVTGAGRTDAGVHAYSMMAHADLPIPHPPLAQIQRGLWHTAWRNIRSLCHASHPDGSRSL